MNSLIVANLSEEKEKGVACTGLRLRATCYKELLWCAMRGCGGVHDEVKARGVNQDNPNLNIALFLGHYIYA